MSRYVKQVIVMRKDLGMRKGKMIAQGAHASIMARDVVWTDHRSVIKIWEEHGVTKICVYVEGDEELIGVYGAALNKKIPAAMVVDSGRTEFHGEPTRTCCAIGPWYADEIDEITGGLPLL